MNNLSTTLPKKRKNNKGKGERGGIQTSSIPMITTVPEHRCSVAGLWQAITFFPQRNL